MDQYKLLAQAKLNGINDELAGVQINILNLEQVLESSKRHRDNLFGQRAAWLEILGPSPTAQVPVMPEGEGGGNGGGQSIEEQDQRQDGQ